MAKPLVLKFDVDDKGSITLKKIRGNVKGLGHDLNTTTKHAKTNADSMATLRNSVILLGAAYATLSVVKAVISDGIAYNKMMENQENGIRALIVATSESTSAQGKALTLQERYTIATKDATDTMRHLILHGFVAVSDKGFIAGIAQPLPLNHEWLVASEFLWWAEDKSGMRLLRAFRNWAKSIGANEIRYSCPSHNKRVQQIFARTGEKNEIIYSEITSCV